MSPPLRTHLLIVLGSGGHTSEMLSMLTRARISPSLYTHRTYIVGSGDGFSAQKAKVFEESLASSGKEKTTGTYNILIIPRARKIHQSLLTTPISAIACLISCIKMLYHHQSGYPDVILTNGPGTGVIVVMASLILRFFAIDNKYSDQVNIQDGRGHAEGEDKAVGGHMRTIFIESWARVKTLSFSGKILLPIVDRFLVQWKGLEGKGDRAEYAGFLI
jgi:beta-1,4-N-acetylglucosaminyltransferase